MLDPEPRHGAITMSNTQQAVVTEPEGLRGSEHSALPGSAKSPPGPAKSTADWPKFVYDAGRSKFVAPRAKPSGAVAETAITWGDIAGKKTVLAVWSRSVALLPRAATTVVPRWKAYVVAFPSATARGAAPTP